MKPAVIYARYSCDNQNEQSIGVDKCAEIIASYVNARAKESPQTDPTVA